MLTYSEALALQGSSFQLSNLQGPQTEPLTLELTEVKDRGSNEMVEQFSLLFRGPLNAPLQQGLYQLEQAKLGPVEWMLVPLGRDVEGFLYEAVFNTLKAPTQS